MGRPGGSGKAAEKAALQLQVSVPSLFRCPISLDVMKSPVSLSTGVTYDRASIQAWLDAGHNTCPATMQVLPTTDVVPNHNLHRLILLWSTQQQQQAQEDDAAASTAELVHRLQSSGDALPPLRKLAEIAGDASRIRELVENADCVPAVNGVLMGKDPVLEEVELAAKVLALVLLGRKENGYEIDGSLGKPPALSSLLAVLKEGGVESRVAAAWVVDAIASTGNEAKLLVAGTEGLLAELLRLLADDDDGKPAEASAVDAALSSLVWVASQRRVRPQIVALGAVSALGKLLARQSTALPAVEKALKLIEAASTCPEGRAAICEDPAVVPAVVGRMMKVSPAATEYAAVVLWSVCHLFRDRRAQEAVATSNGLTKILLLMQSNCSPGARDMAGDLLRIFRVGSKSCLPGCEFKTTHIMPF
ncbi:hypothetical protein Taro_032475 [Colocasia esculenta]|uniref:U-box domain-containing protein n=1 Tax=Colocasia esculenta TaxID=4460 RepID=A0A843VZ89_COLES|nr:hypothetical protein [Colocasia esculenta]